ncbi:hypothetical protein PHYC_02009 [Phycisphaerales bacterium]|nr:hypothetical protein PHYC_02009 [Phycisphaerales bacterium]
MPPDEQIRIAEATLDRLLDMVRAIDAKTPIVLAINTGMLGVAMAMAPALSQWTEWTMLCASVAVLCPAVSLVLCAVATFPHTDGPGKSLVYFGGIQRLPINEFMKGACGRTQPEYLEDMLRQVHRNAQIAWFKYRFIQHSLRWLFLGLAPWVAGVIFLFQR